MTTTRTHAHPWTFRQFMADLFAKPTPRPTSVLSGREATARHLFGEAVQWLLPAMLRYDTDPEWQAVWLAEADRRIASAPSIPDLLVLRHWGYTKEEWAALPAIVKADKREHFFQTQGMTA